MLGSERRLVSVPIEMLQGRIIACETNIIRGAKLAQAQHESEEFNGHPSPLGVQSQPLYPSESALADQSIIGESERGLDWNTSSATA
jgi:hypothetical protein